MVLRWSKRNTQKVLEKGKGEGEKMELYFNFKKIPLKSIHCFYIRYTLLEWLVVAEKTYSLFWNSTHSLSTQPLLYCKLSPIPETPPEIRPPPSNLTPVLSVASPVLGAPQTLCRRWFSLLKQAAHFVSASGHQVFAYHLLRATY